MYDNIEDLSQEELKELDELAKYNNILNDKFESFGKYARIKEPKVKIADIKKSKLPEDEKNDPNFPKNQEMESILPDDVDKICDPCSITIEGSGKSEAPEGILKKGNNILTRSRRQIRIPRKK